MTPSAQQIFNPESLIDQACQAIGTEDFGAGEFYEPLKLLCRSLIEDANLSAGGTELMGQRIINLLQTRLRVSNLIEEYPQILNEKIVKPVFIAALPRTGTTMLHRFIASDSRMLAVLWYECRSPAPLTPIETLDQDPRVAAAKEEVRMMLENMPGLDAIHPMDAEGPDEEIMLMEHSFCSGMPLSMANVTLYNEWESQADHSCSYEYLKLLLQMLQWIKKKRGHQGQRWILKAPEHVGLTQTLLQVFPDATIIQGHRDPMVTIPSIASFIYSGWAAYTDEPDKHLIGQLWAKRFEKAMNRCMTHRQTMPQNCMLDLWYEDLIADPFSQAQKIYDHLGIELTDTALASMARWREDNRREKRAPHQYTLEEYGFTEAGIAEQFGAYREQYILSRQ